MAAIARCLSVRTVVVHTDVEAQARHVRACDEAVQIGGESQQGSDPQGGRILFVARETAVQAVPC